jgi:integrase
MLITKQNIETLRIPEGKSEVEFWDAKLKGLGVRIRGDSRRFFFFYRIGQTKHRMALGPATRETVDKVREEVGKLIARVKLGEDPALTVEKNKQQAGELVEPLIQLFLQRHEREWKPKTYIEAERYLTRSAKPLHKLPVTGVTQAAVVKLLDEIAENSGDVTANRARAYLCSFYNWVLSRWIELPKGNPVEHIEKRAETSRKRVLTDDELRAVWNACRDDDFGAIVKLLMLTGQRREEIGALRHAEIKGDLIEYPDQRTKNGIPHFVPLSDPALAILARFPANGREFVFGHAGFRGWVAKAKLDERSGVKDCTLHDLRRTTATRLAQDIGTAPHVIEAILNHVSGHKAGVAGVYNRATYSKERREALNLWADRLLAIVEGRLAKVVPLKRGA